MYEAIVFAGKKEKRFEGQNQKDLLWFCRTWSKIIKARESAIIILQENKVIHHYTFIKSQDVLVEVSM